MPIGLRAYAVPVAVVLTASAALLAGCGSSRAQPTPAYVREVDAVASGLGSVTNMLYTPADATSAAAELATVQAAFRKAARQLAAITPPRAVAAYHRRLVESLDELANGVAPLIAKLKAGDLVAVDPASLLKGSSDARAAIAAITNAGYEIRIPLLS
jgi:hypothetical protein